MNWSIIIFSYNEAQNIKKVILDTIQFISTQSAQSEIIIINDGSTDNSKQIITEFTDTNPAIKAHHFPSNRGIGPALNKGYDLATQEYVCAIPGDGQFDIEELHQVTEFDSSTFITFYRPNKNYDWYRGFLTRGNHFFNKWLLGINVPDVNWIKVYKKEQIHKKYRTLNSSLVESEICAKLIKSGCKHKDFPSRYLPRRHGEAKGSSWKTLKSVIKEMYRLYKIVKQFPQSKFN